MRKALGALALAAVALALALLPLKLAALAAGAVAAGVLLLWRPWLVWVALGMALPFAAAWKIGPASALDLLLAGAFALWFLDGVRRGTLAVAQSAPLAAALAFLALHVVTVGRARDFGQALVEVVKWAEFAAVLALAPVFLRALPAGKSLSGAPHAPAEDPLRVRWVALGLVAGAAAQALLGLYQFFFRVGPEWFTLPGGFMRAAGTYGQPNPFAASLGLVLPVAASMALWAWGEGARTRPRLWNVTLLWALLWTGAAALLGAGLLASWSRGGWLGAAAALAAVVVLRSRRAALAAGVALLLLASALLLGALSPATVEAWVPAPVLARLAEIPAFFGYGDPLAQEVTDENFAVIERVAHWVAAWRMFGQEPWLGVGAGSYAAAYPAVAVPRWPEPLGHAHNAWLNTLAELGVVGGLLAALLWGTLAVWLARALRCFSRQAPASRSAREQRALVVGVLGVLVYLAVHSLVDLLFVQGMVVTLALWPALIVAVWPSPVRDAAPLLAAAPVSPPKDPL